MIHLAGTKEKGSVSALVARGLQKAGLLNISLSGIHQAENESSTFTALEIAHQEGVNLTEYNIHKSFENVVWPG